MDQTHTLRNWSIIGVIVVLIGLAAWFYTGTGANAPVGGGTTDATAEQPATTETAPADAGTATEGATDGTATEGTTGGTTGTTTGGTNP